MAASIVISVMHLFGICLSLAMLTRHYTSALQHQRWCIGSACGQHILHFLAASYDMGNGMVHPSAERNRCHCAFTQVRLGRMINCWPTHAIHCWRSMTVRSQYDFLHQWSCTIMEEEELSWARFNVPPNTLSVISGTGFMGQMTQPTVSKQWRKPGPKD